MTDPVIDEFLSQQKKGTALTYKTNLKLYMEYKKLTGQQLLDEKRSDKDFNVEKDVLSFRRWMTEKNSCSTYYAVATVGAVRGFYSYYRIPLVFRKHEGKKLTERIRVTADYLFDREDLTKMSLAGGLKERYVLLLGKSLGLRAGDFVKLTFGQFRCLKLDSDPPIAFGEIGTGKEKIKAYPFLDTDTIPVVKAWLESHKDAKDTDRMIDDTEDNLTANLQTLCEKAGMEIKDGTIHGKRVRFHSLRKFLIDRLSAYAGESQWKQIVGKAIGEGAYVSQEQLRGVFTRAMKDIVINGNGIKVKKLVELESALVDSQRRLTSLETTNDVLRRELSSITGKVEFFDKYLNLVDVVETNDDAERLLDFLGKMRNEKYLKEKERHSRVEGDAEDRAFKERVLKETADKR
jgi:integrase